MMVSLSSNVRIFEHASHFALSGGVNHCNLIAGLPSYDAEIWLAFLRDEPGADDILAYASCSAVITVRSSLDGSIVSMRKLNSKWSTPGSLEEFVRQGHKVGEFDGVVLNALGHGNPFGKDTNELKG